MPKSSTLLLPILGGNVLMIAYAYHVRMYVKKIKQYVLILTTVRRCHLALARNAVRLHHHPMHEGQPVGDNDDC